MDGSGTSPKKCARKLKKNSEDSPFLDTLMKLKKTKKGLNFKPFYSEKQGRISAKIIDKIMLDPNENEERVLDARFTITLDGNNNICL